MNQQSSKTTLVAVPGLRPLDDNQVDQTQNQLQVFGSPGFEEQLNRTKITVDSHFIRNPAGYVWDIVKAAVPKPVKVLTAKANQGATAVADACDSVIIWRRGLPGHYFTNLARRDIRGKFVTDLLDTIALASQSVLSLIGSKTSPTNLVVSYPEFTCVSMAFRRWRFRPLNQSSVPGSQHPHHSEALHRRETHQNIIRFVKSLSKTVFEISFSRRSFSRGFHSHMTARDLQFPERDDIITDDDIIVMVDFDYYCNLDQIMSNLVPVIMYTMTPSSTSGQTNNSQWYIKNNILHRSVDGGGEYKHLLYDYTPDYITTSYGLSKIISRVDRINVGMEYSVVLLTPVAVIPLNKAYKMILPTPRRRLKTNINGVYDAMTNTQGTLSITLNHDLRHISVPKDIFLACRDRWISSRKPLVGDLDAVLRHFKVKNEYSTAVSLMHIFQQGYTALPELEVIQYTAVMRDGDIIYDASQDRSRSDTDLPPPCDTSPAIPFNNTSNDVAAQVMRHQMIKNTKRPPAKYNKYAKEFCKCAADLFGLSSIMPYTLDQVRDKQNKPQQRNRNEASSSGPTSIESCKVKAFVKAEFYTSIKDPRNISNVNVRHQINLSRFTYPVKYTILMSCHWYDPGQSLEEIAQRVHLTCAPVSEVVETDFSKFDGTISRWLRTSVEFPFIGQFLTPESCPEFEQLCKSELSATSFAGPRRYDPDGSRLSGSPLTTDGNTLISAFVDFCTWRETGAEPNEAWIKIGRKFGDDGVSAVALTDQGTPLMEKVAADLGLNLKAVIKSTSGPVGYLGRIFVSPKFTTTSLQDPSRVWPRLNTRLRGKQFLHMCQRWASYLRTDAKTPLLNAYITRALHLSNYVATGDEERDGYIYSENLGIWPQLAQDVNALSQVESSLCSVSDVDSVISDLNNASSMTHLRRIAADNIRFNFDSMSVPTHIERSDSCVPVVVPVDISGVRRDNANV